MPLPLIRVSNLNTLYSPAMVIVHFIHVTMLNCYLLGNSPVQFVLPYSAGTPKWQTDSRIPACPLAKALTYLLDITTPPSQSFLHKLSHMTKQEDDQQHLLALAKVTPPHRNNHIVPLIMYINRVDIVHLFIMCRTFI